MDSAQVSKLEMFFFPFVGGGHMLPMVDAARLFASHGVKSTIIAPPTAAISLHSAVQRDQQSGHHITLRTLTLPPDQTLDAADMSAPPSTDTSVLQEPLHRLLTELRPDCFVFDMFHSWSADVVDGLGIPRIVFTGNGCFSRCAENSLRRHAPHEKVDSDFEPFLLPGLPNRIELTRSQLPIFVRTGPGGGDRMRRSMQNNFGVLVNSFYELEPAYADYFKKEITNRAWLIGPVSLCNRNVEDKVERGKDQISIDAQNCLDWLDSKNPNSVLYVSFGSLARIPPTQLVEIAYGLEASGHPFIWVIGKVSGDDDGEAENWVPKGFQQRISESKKGLIIRGWAPQLLILEHAATGGFVTHCGWNSTLEAVTAGVPVVTWPLSAEQFYNEKLLTDVLKIGVRVGSVEWVSWKTERKETVGREKVAKAVEQLMGGGEQTAVMSRRARELAEKAKKAVEEGGSSYADAEALIDELKSHRERDDESLLCEPAGTVDGESSL
ncbi:abscisate beta-glucosyltransferase-like isoform X2 [Malania oleifera]|uniref:abscisate beta-glucosyltransferase-like isoform X2 n=1 Tax=Malania oleifera TaxID=397392 RepID=UPI0025AE183B|nr:abscisate beta-glucosyltransferase-like isoform X2 [Malania oleifera]